MNSLLHQSITLSLPYYPWQAYYQRVRSDPDMTSFLDSKMIPALESVGDPAKRLEQMSEAAQAARVALAEAGRQADQTFNGLDPVETDLRVAFFTDLSAAIAAAEASVADKVAALEFLIALVQADAPIGLPEPNPYRSWEATARLTAVTEIQVHLETLLGT